MYTTHHNCMTKGFPEKRSNFMINYDHAQTGCTIVIHFGGNNDYGN